MASKDITYCDRLLDNVQSTDNSLINSKNMYEMYVSPTSDNITIKFYQEGDYQSMMDLLKSMYTFTLTKDKTGITTTQDIDNNKVVITSYHTMTLLIQGTGCRLWRENVFDSLASNFTGSNGDSGNPVSNNMKTLQVSSTPKKSKSNFFGSLISKVVGPPINNDQVKLGKEMKKAKKRAKKGGPPVNLAYYTEQCQKILDNSNKKSKGNSVSGRPLNYLYNRPLNSFSVPKQKARCTTEIITNDSKDDIQSLCTEFSEPSTDELNWDYSHDSVTFDETCVKTLFQNDKQEENPDIQNPTMPLSKEPNLKLLAKQPQSKDANSLLDHDVFNGKEQDEVSSLRLTVQILQQECDVLKETNTKLRHINEEQNTKLKSFFDSTEKLKTTHTDLNNKVSEQKALNQQLKSKNDEQAKQLSKVLDAAEQFKSQNNDMKSRITDLTSKVLILDEENTKLHSSVKSLKAENKKLQSNLSKTSLTSENSDKMLSELVLLTDEMNNMKSVLKQVHNKVDNSASQIDIQLLRLEMKNTLKENRQETVQLEQSSNTPQVTPDDDQHRNTKNTTSQSRRENSSTRNQNINERNTTVTTEQSKKQILILGDSVTRVIDPRRLSGDKYSVKIKTNPGARIEQLKSKIPKTDHMTTCDAILLHVGINNFCDGDRETEIILKYKDLISEVKNVNKTARIIVSSILPKKTDNHSSKLISDINKQLKHMCDSQQDTDFMDNTDSFSQQRNIMSLFTDELHLSTKGAALFAKNIMKSIDSVLKTGYNTNTRYSLGNFRAPSLRNPSLRNLGRQRQPQARRVQRRKHPNSMLPPWMWMYPPPPQYF